MTHPLPAPLDVRLMNQTASVLFMACVVLVLAAGVGWVLRHPNFSIVRIVVEGDLVHNNEVTLRANVAPQLVGNFFTLNLRTARDAFEQAPWVRSARVQRQYPRTLHVVLQEHNAVAHWGLEPGTAMVNSYGEVFEANGSDTDDEDLPRLYGPQGQSAQVLQMYGLLQAAFGGLNMPVRKLELSGRGGWRTTLGSGAVVELGGGSAADVERRAKGFVGTLTQVAAQYGRRPDALEAADLRHGGGYAVRLRGVTTVAPVAPGAAAARR